MVFVFTVTAIDYYTKWPEAAPLTNKSATAVAQFLYSLICRHGCPEIEISDQGREFVNQVQQELHQLTGVEHRVASAYHPQVRVHPIWLPFVQITHSHIKGAKGDNGCFHNGITKSLLHL